MLPSGIGHDPGGAEGRDDAEVPAETEETSNEALRPWASGVVDRQTTCRAKLSPTLPD
jgi:hypothetical protein